MGWSSFERSEKEIAMFPHQSYVIYNVLYIYQNISALNSAFPQRLENLENENGHGKALEHDKLGKSHGTFYQSWNLTNVVPE